MFRQSLKRTCALPIAALACLLFFSFLSLSEYNNQFVPDKTNYGFMNYIVGSGGTAIMCVVTCFIAAGIINALLLFNFVTSKKQSNVIFSLGMTRTEIFTSRFLAGTLPMLVAISIAAVVDFIIFPVGIYGVNKAVCLHALAAVLYFMSVYLLSFSAVTIIISNSGNLVEGLIFTALIAGFPYSLAALYYGEFNLFVFGAEQYDKGPLHFDLFYAPLYSFEGSYIDTDYQDFIFRSFRPQVYKDGTTNIPFDEFFLRPLIAIAIAVAVFALGIWAFNRRRNEISGSWGKAKNLNIFCGGLVGLYAFEFAICAVASNMYSHGNGNFATYILCFIFFAIGVFLFHLIFSSKRKASIKWWAKSLPVYAAVMGAVTLVFSCGYFGYSSKIPDAKNVSNVTVTSSLWEYKEDQMFFNDSWLGLSSQVATNIDFYYGYGIDMSTSEEIEKVVELHKAIVENGKIRNNAADACADAIEIEYTMKDGSTIKRRYTESDFEIAKKIIKLNDIESLKNLINDFAYNEDITGYEIDSEGDPYYVDEYGSVNYVDIISGVPGGFAGKLYNMFHYDAFLFPKDMKQGYCIGKDDELIENIKKDLIAQTSDELFLHSPDDEIGVISFGLSYNYMTKNSYYYVDNNGRAWDEYGNEIETEIFEKGKYYETNWNLKSSDVTSILLTKDMTNTIKYLESKDLMKYFKSDVTANDVSSIKVATTKELYRCDRSKIYPTFSAAYWEKDSVTMVREHPDEYSYHADYFGTNVNNVITNHTVIQEVLDNSKLFGLCDNDDMIVEIKYTDGSMATTYIDGDTYKQIMK